MSRKERSQGSMGFQFIENQYLPSRRCRRTAPCMEFPAVCLEVKSVGKPDAGNPHVRFDERGGETESRQAGLRRCLERGTQSHRKPAATAPLFDSTASVGS